MANDSGSLPGADDDLVTIVSTEPTTARVYDYLMGGDDNFAVDREIADRVAGHVGGMDNALAGLQLQRAFRDHSLRRLAGELGVRQFLDIGVGIPTPETIPPIAQQAAADARVVYVDNDPLVLAHAHSLQRSTPEGVTAYVNADLRDPAAILKQAATTLDFDRPVAIVLVAILHLFDDDEDPYGIVSQLVDAVASGSYLLATHAAADIQAEEMARLAEHIRATTPGALVLRDAAAVARFFDGLELVEPGLVPLDRWQAWRDGAGGASDGDDPGDPGEAGDAGDAAPAWRPPYHGGIGRKP